MVEPNFFGLTPGSFDNGQTAGQRGGAPAPKPPTAAETEAAAKKHAAQLAKDFEAQEANRAAQLPNTTEVQKTLATVVTGSSFKQTNIGKEIDAAMTKDNGKWVRWGKPATTANNFVENLGYEDNRALKELTQAITEKNPNLTIISTTKSLSEVKALANLPPDKQKTLFETGIYLNDSVPGAEKKFNGDTKLNFGNQQISVKDFLAIREEARQKLGLAPDAPAASQGRGDLPSPVTPGAGQGAGKGR